MCTVTFLPVDKRSYILTANRDESLKRKVAIPPTINSVGNVTAIYPVDGEAKGTWIAAGNNGRIVCLLNGAFYKHKHSPPYKKSRGLVVLDSFAFKDSKSFAVEYDHSGIEPYTMIWIERNNKITIRELRWDGNSMTVKRTGSDQPLIWSSVTLYDQETINKRKKWFAQWLTSNKSYSVEKIRQFHHFGGEGDVTSNIKMKIGKKLATVSITSINVCDDQATMYYEDIIADNLMDVSISINKLNNQVDH